MVRGSGFGGGKAVYVVSAAKVRDDFKGKSDFVAISELVNTFQKARVEFTVSFEQAQAVYEAAEIAWGKMQPAAGLPFVGIKSGIVETGERDFVEQCKILGKR